MRTFLALCVALLTLPARAEGPILTWTSADGVVHFTNDPSTIPAHQRTQPVKGSAVSVKLATEQSAPARRPPCPPTRSFQTGHRREADAFLDACPDSKVTFRQAHSPGKQ